jgi:hypothetical protein
MPQAKDGLKAKKSKLVRNWDKKNNNEKNDKQQTSGIQIASIVSIVISKALKKYVKTNSKGSCTRFQRCQDLVVAIGARLSKCYAL